MHLDTLQRHHREKSQNKPCWCLPYHVTIKRTSPNLQTAVNICRAVTKTTILKNHAAFVQLRFSSCLVVALKNWLSINVLMVLVLTVYVSLSMDAKINLYLCVKHYWIKTYPNSQKKSQYSYHKPYYQSIRTLYNTHLSSHYALSWTHQGNQCEEDMWCLTIHSSNNDSYQTDPVH